MGTMGQAVSYLLPRVITPIYTTDTLPRLTWAVCTFSWFMLRWKLSKSKLGAAEGWASITSSVGMVIIVDRYPYLDYLDIYQWAAEEARLSQCCHYYPSSSWFLPSAWSAAWRLQWMLWPLTWHFTRDTWHFLRDTWHVLPETITASSAASWPRCSGSRWTELELLKFLNTPFSIFVSIYVSVCSIVSNIMFACVCSPVSDCSIFLLNTLWLSG